MTSIPFLAKGGNHSCSGTLLCEIRILETRLREMGFDGDSAYEKRLINQYHDMIHERRKELAQFVPTQPTNGWIQRVAPNIVLSFIYQLFRDYQLSHHFRPNVLYISHAHLEVLQTELEIHCNPDKIRHYLGIEIIVRSRLPHPKVGWLQSAARKAGWNA